MRHILSQRAVTLLTWGCILAVVLGLSQLTSPAAAQTPTPIPVTPTFTPTPVGPTATPTLNLTGTPLGRVIEFRSDDDAVAPGSCVEFSWVVKPEAAVGIVEFEALEVSKPVLVESEVYDYLQCPDDTTEYVLRVTWLDGTQSAESIEIEVNKQAGTAIAAATAAAPPPGTFVAVSPIPVAVGGITYGTPVGALGSVQVLPETGYQPPGPAGSPGDTGPPLAGGLALACVGVVVGLGVATLSRREREGAP